MTHLFDSLCAVILFFSAILSWGMAEGARAAARLNIRFAAAMLAALSAARLMPNFALALDVALLTPCPAAATSFLALSFPRRASVLISCLFLAAGLAAGLLAAALDMPVLALGYQASIALVLFAWSLSRFGENPHAALLASLAAASLFLGAMAVMNASLSAAMLFFAALMPLVARASQAEIADPRRQARWLISGERA